MKENNATKTIKSNVFSNWLLDVYLETKRKNSYNFFITVTFKRNAIDRRRRSSEGVESTFTEFDRFHHVYNTICAELLGKNYHRKHLRGHLPKVVACMDVQATKHWSSPGDVVNAHIHSVWNIENKDKDKFLQFVECESNIASFAFKYQIDGFYNEKISDDDLEDTISYSSKFLRFNFKEILIDEDVRIYPLSKSYLELVRKDPEPSNSEDEDGIHKRHPNYRSRHFGGDYFSEFTTVPIEQKIRILKELILKSPNEVQNTKIASLWLSAETKRILKEEGIKTLYDLAQVSIDKIASLRPNGTDFIVRDVFEEAIFQTR